MVIVIDESAEICTPAAMSARARSACVLRLAAPTMEGSPEKEQPKRRAHLLAEEAEKVAGYRRLAHQQLTQQLQLERLTGELLPAARCLSIGATFALAMSTRPIPELGLVVPHPLAPPPRFGPYPHQLTLEIIERPSAPSFRIQGK